MTSNSLNGRGFSPLTSRVTRKILVTLLTGGLAYLVTNAVQDDQLAAIALSAFFGGSALIVQFMVDMDDRLDNLEREQTVRLDGLERRQTNRLEALESQQEARLRALAAAQDARNGEVRDLVQQSYSKISRATRLFELVEASALRTDAVIQLVQHSTQIGPDVPPLVSRVAQEEIERISRFLKELGDGTVTSYEGEDRDWLLTLALNAKVSIDATSLNTVDARGRGLDSSFWQSDLGQRYLEVQRHRVSHDRIKVRRLFIVDRGAGTPGPDFLDICRLQARMGIEVRILNAAELELPLKTKLLDFILFDNIISYETTPAYRVEKAWQPEIVKTELQLKPRTVEERVERYRDLWERATPFAE
jgi:hypothetical protein